MIKAADLLQNYFVSATRNLSRNLLDSFIKIFGLAIGLTAAMLITLFVRDELSFDQFWTDADQLYRLNTTWVFPGRTPQHSAITSGPASRALRTYFPNEIVSSARINNKEPTLTLGDRVYIEQVSWVDPSILAIFNFEVLAGDAQETLADNNGLVITQSLASKYFGDMNPIGEILTATLYGVTRDYRVGAVIRDLPFNTHLDIQAMVKIVEQDFAEPAWWMFSNWKAINNHTYFKLEPDVPIEQFASRLAAFARDIIPPNTDVETQLSMTPVQDIHLHPQDRSEMKNPGDGRLVLALMVIAVLLVVIGAINFINLSTAQAGKRAKEVALRMTLGARRQQLFVQHLGESVLIATIAFLVAIVMVEISLPLYNGMLNRQLFLNLGDPRTLATIFTLMFSIGVTAGLYPAAVISAFRPARNLNSSNALKLDGSVSIRSLLVLFQTAMTISLLIATVVVFAQLSFIKSLDRGFDAGQLVVLNGISRDGAYENREALKTEIRKLAQVENAAFTSDPPSRPNGNNTRVKDLASGTGEYIPVGVQDIDADLLPTYRMELLAGRNFSTSRPLDRIPSTGNVSAGSTLSGNIIINQAAVRLFGFNTAEQALGHSLRLDPEMQANPSVNVDLTVVGVVGNSNLHSAKKEPRPEIYQVTPNNLHMVIRYKGEEKPLISALENTWRRLAPTAPFQYFLVEQALASDLDNENKQLSLFAAFSVLAIIIGSMGLYGLAALVTEQRTREIGLRKVMGASVFQVMNLLLWQFSKPVLASNLIAWPVSFYLMHNWLNNFPDRIGSSWLIAVCLATGLISVFISWVTVSGHALRVASANPVNALRCQ
ncbi:MAG: ABC transporter permease [Xanthomonadales bacterium]|nr:ABC transporter permease [Xanthomonadales bacterium]